jgi:hypothetical protein
MGRKKGWLLLYRCRLNKGGPYNPTASVNHVLTKVVAVISTDTVKT